VPLRGSLYLQLCRIAGTFILTKSAIFRLVHTSRLTYRKGKWPINTSHGWKIRAATKGTEDLFAACPDVPVKIGDVEIDQNFFVQDEVSHSVILGQPFITASRMETKGAR
jgi:hypothetical protein